MVSVTEADIQGVYSFEWAGGSFEVHLRPGGYFFAPEYQAAAHWTLDGDSVYIEWGKVRSLFAQCADSATAKLSCESKDLCDCSLGEDRGTLLTPVKLRRAARDARVPLPINPVSPAFTEALLCCVCTVREVRYEGRRDS